MTVVSAFMVPGSPLPYLQRDNPPWGRLADAMDVAGQALAKSNPDTIVVYSNQWMAVMDQLWQTRAHISGLLVDQNWHEYGELPYDIHIDKIYAEAAIQGTIDNGVKAKGVDYDEFPIDVGTIIASNFLNPESKYPLLIGSNNAYHDWDTTLMLGRVVTEQAKKLNRRIAVIGVGGLSGSFYRDTIDISKDKIVTDAEDQWNKKILTLIEQGDIDALSNACPDFIKEAKSEMGFKQLAFLLGALGEDYVGAKIHAYEPVYGSGAAVIEFKVS